MLTKKIIAETLLSSTLIAAPLLALAQNANGALPISTFSPTSTPSTTISTPLASSAPAIITPRKTNATTSKASTTKATTTKATTTVATATPIVATAPVIPEPTGIDPFWFVASIPFLAAIGYLYYAFRKKGPALAKASTVASAATIKKPSIRMVEKKNDDEKKSCPSLKKLMEEKFKELTDVRGQLKSAVETKLRDKVREASTGTEREIVLAKIEKAEAEYKKLKDLYENCILSDAAYEFVTSNENPDLDGYASSIAYSEFLNKSGRKAMPVIFGKPLLEAQYLIGKLKFRFENEISHLKGAKRIILVDTSTLTGLDKSISPENVEEIIDHRKTTDTGAFKNADKKIELVGAAATLIAEKFIKANISISKISATLLYGAIVSNTLNFRSKLTTERDIEAAKWLIETAEPEDDFAKEMFTAKSDLSGSKLKEAMSSDVSQYLVEGTRLGISQLEIVGAAKLIETRTSEIFSELKNIAKTRAFDVSFLSILALDENSNYFLTEDTLAQRILSKAFELEFNDGIARKKGLLMRKEIVPTLRTLLIDDTELMQ
jgi:inorganic pyrophosphatase/exopolyphosphatase